MDRKLADYRIRRHLPTVLFIIYACRQEKKYSIWNSEKELDYVQREIWDGKNKQEAAFSPEHQIGNSFQRSLYSG